MMTESSDRDAIALMMVRDSRSGGPGQYASVALQISLGGYYWYESSTESAIRFDDQHLFPTVSRQPRFQRVAFLADGDTQRTELAVDAVRNAFTMTHAPGLRVPPLPLRRVGVGIVFADGPQVVYLGYAFTRALILPEPQVTMLAAE